MDGSGVPRVSIGMPVYNGSQFIRRAIDSILIQEFKDLELVISDNASEDDTSTICEEYSLRDARIRYHRNDVNIGATANFNRTFEMSRGQYFKWAAHDDFIHPAYLRRCVEELDRRPDAVLACTTQAVVDYHGNVNKIYNRDIDLWGCMDRGSGSSRFHNILWHLKDCYPVFGLIRRNALGRTRLITNNVEPDRILLGDLSLIGPFIRIREPLFFRALHPPRDQWEWLNPANPRWRRLATPRMVGQHLEALRRSTIHPAAKAWLALDVLIAIPARRTRWKLRKVRPHWRAALSRQWASVRRKTRASSGGGSGMERGAPGR
jgi:glycosyltransferase involved in cell wall biosynthesis